MGTKTKNKKSTAAKTKSQFDVNPIVASPVVETGSEVKPEIVIPPVTVNRTDESFDGVKKITISGTEVVARTGEAESTVETVKLDNDRMNGIQPVMDMPEVMEGAEIPDELTTCFDNPWAHNKQVKSLALRDETNVLHRFEYMPQPLLVGTKKTRYSILACSDNGAIVGKPYAGSYSLLNNGDFIAIIEAIGAELDKLGLKYQVSTTGTIMGRERSFISLQINQQAGTVIDGREFKAFLNCLNSIPSNQGCTVTFANNTFCVCCRNTFAMCLHDKEGAKFHAAIKHTKGMKASLGDIPKLVNAYFSGNEEIFASLKSFSVFPVSLEQAEDYFAAFIGRDAKGNLTDKTSLSTRTANIIETLKGLHVKGKGNKGETALDLFQAATEYYTHFSAGKSDDKMKQYQSSEAGDGYNSKGEFYQWLMKSIQSTASFNAIAKVGNTLLVNYRKAKA
jgi:hypothetical protein